MSGFGFSNSTFGSNTNQTSSSFGGFGTNTATSGGFGSNSSPFGSNNNTNPGGSIFGAGNNTNNNTSGSAFGGFGTNNNSNTNSIFGNKSAFGSTTTTSAGLFGNNTATSGTGGFSGFGTSNTSGFGSSNTGGFGANKSTFGSATTTNPLFGANNNNSTGGFGSSNTGGGFGSSTSAPFGSGKIENNGTVATANTPFQPHHEKEPNSSTTNYYQSITASPNYQKYSVEELRCVDYAQNRKYGTQSGAGGGFGQSAFGGGGFGSSTTNTTNNAFGTNANTNTNTGGLFGNSGNNSFGSNNNNNNSGTGGFGSNSGGGLFGQKPATGSGLFGSSTTTTAPAGGGLFGSNNAFGNNNPNNNNSNPGGFGANSFGNNNNNQQQNKPFGGGFGTSNTPSLFGNAAASGGGFGTTNNNNNNNNATNTGFGQSTNNGFGAFGNNNQTPNQNQNQAQGGTGLFGQQKTGLFGNTNSNPSNTGGLFGNQPNQQQSGSLFGASNNNSTTSNLFGAKPATSGGLFGQSNQTTSNGLFGNANQQQNTGSSLFGSNNQQNGGLFGTKPAASNSLFGSTSNQQNTGTNMFGAAQSQSGGNSLFGSQQQQQPMQSAQPSHLIASLADSPYGSAQLFAGLASPAQSLGPVATPLSASSKTRKQAIIPQHRIMPQAASRLITPQKRPGGYGFSYSNYNSPASSTSGSPMNSNLLSPMGRSLGKSMSTSNLRHSFSAQESIISPNAFSNVTRSGPGSMKKLSINRNVSNRRSLFGNETIAPLSKKVSFENGVTGGSAPSSTASSSALIRTEDIDPTPIEISSSPVTEPSGSTGKELALVSEGQSEEASLEAANRKARQNQKDQVPGGYKMSPNISEIQAMSREQRSKVKDFTVSREGVGIIVFSQVDLNTVPLEQICGQIVELEVRRATVYGDDSPIKTPPQGEGLNVPSRITLENSWPRGKAGRLRVPEKSGASFEKHIKLLKACKDTTFISYDIATGVWIFEVQHYTTYGLDYDDDDESAMDTTTMDTTNMDYTENTQNLATASVFNHTPFVQGNSSNNSSAGSMDDTFAFKFGQRVSLPGQFNEEEFVEEMEVEDVEEPLTPSHNREIDNESKMDFQPDQSVLINLAESKSQPILKESDALSIFDQDGFGLDEHVLHSNWTEQLLQTASPLKRDRHILRDHQDISNQSVSDRKPLEVNQPASFGTTLDIMKSLFQSPKSVINHSKVNEAPQKISKLTFESKNRRDPEDGVRFSSMTTSGLKIPETIRVQEKFTDITIQSTDTPFAQTTNHFEFSALANAADSTTQAGKYESHVWQLSSILFDSVENEVPVTLQSELRASYGIRIRREKFSEFWQKVVQPDIEAAIFEAKTPEERAFIYLTGGNVTDACGALLAGKNFHLAQIVAQIGGDEVFRATMAKQLDDWLDLNVSSEMNDYFRAIYELLAGHTLESKGKAGPGSENKVPSFKFSTRFNLDWKRAFGLRLWYGTLREEDIATAIIKFNTDLEVNHEPAKPLPWFNLANVDMGWDDPAPQSREDVLWSLLRVYVDLLVEDNTAEDMPLDVPALFTPENTAGNPQDLRMSFQLTSLMLGKTLDFSKSTYSELVISADKLATRFATSLERHISQNPDLLVLAAWSLLHLTDRLVRSKKLKSLFDKHAALLVSSANLTSQLQDKLMIPSSWICKAKATYAKDVMHDELAETQWLIDGGEISAAHAVICETIGPKAVIEGDFDDLGNVLEALSKTELVETGEWNQGAGLFFDYVALLHQSDKKSKEAKIEVKKLVKRLCSQLEAIAADGMEGRHRMEKIGFQLMAKKVVEVGRYEGVLDSEHVLRLPLSESGYLEQSKLMSMKFYEAQLVRAK